MNIGAIIQARIGSSRYPEKIMKEINGQPVLQHVYDRINASEVDLCIIATTDTEKDDLVQKYCDENNILCFRGSEEDVLSRFYFAAKKYNLDIIVRGTADDPLKDTKVINKAISIMKKNTYDYVSNTIKPTYPEGIDIEIFTFSALERAYKESVLPSEREHVTPYIWKNSDIFKCYNFCHNKNLSGMRWTMDTEDDYKFMVEIYSHFKGKDNFCMEDILEILEKYSDIQMINKGHIRNEGYLRSVQEDNKYGK